MRSHYLRAASDSAGLDDSAYSGFFTSGASPLDFNTTAVTTGLIQPGYGNAFIDHNSDRAWVTTPLGSPAGYFSKTWGSTVPNATSFYNLGSSTATPTNLPTYTRSSGLSATTFYDVTIGYLQDFTPVLIFHNGGDSSFYFYTLEQNPSFIGHLNLLDTNGNTLQPKGVCYDGSHILFLSNRTPLTTVYGIDMPASTTAINGANTTVTTKNTLTTSPSLEDSLIWTGDGVIHPISGGYQHVRFTGSGLTGSSTNYKTFSGGYPSYWGMAVSYKWRQMVLVRKVGFFTFVNNPLYTE